MYIKRDMEPLIKQGAQQVPVVAIIGPRQSGKSTLARHMFPDHVYLDMQDIELLDFASSDPKGFLNYYRNESGIILDEVQYAPHLFSQIKVEADKDPRPGYYILSGSQNFLLHEKINESLAGRVYFYNLLPLSVAELQGAAMLLEDSQQQIFKGFYPRVYQPQIQSLEYYQNYISTYIERDIRTIRNIDSIVTFKKFMQLCALRTGTTINITELAGQCGIAQPTARSWISLLETSFILFMLPSYHENLGKRVTKSSKLYFYDVGLAAALMGFTQETLLKDRVLYGALFENMIIVDLIKNSNMHVQKPQLSYFRDANKKEIDLIAEWGSTVTAIEIKASTTLQSSFFDTITWFAKLQERAIQGVVVYGGDATQQRSQGWFFSWKNCKELIARITSNGL